MIGTVVVYRAHDGKGTRGLDAKLNSMTNLTPESGGHQKLGVESISDRCWLVFKNLKFYDIKKEGIPSILLFRCPLQKMSGSMSREDD